MRFESKTFCLPKDSEYPDQYQDAFDLDPHRGIAAIADGVSSALFSGPWARLLTRATIEEPLRLEDHETFKSWLGRQRSAWSAGIDVSRLAWHQRPKLVDGAMSTLLWVELWPDENPESEGQDDGHVANGAAPSYHWFGFAIGDCQFFQVRQGQTMNWFPMQNSAEFGLNPAVLGSIDRKHDHLLEFKAVDGKCQAGDLLVLCTDAIGLWAMTRQEAGDPVDWEPYWDLPHEAWRDEIFALRREGSMRYDDSTLVLLRVVEDVPAELPAEEAPPALESMAAAAESDEDCGQAESAALADIELPGEGMGVPDAEGEPATAECSSPAAECASETSSASATAPTEVVADCAESLEPLGGVQTVLSSDAVLAEDPVNDS